MTGFSSLEASIVLGILTGRNSMGQGLQAFPLKCIPHDKFILVVLVQPYISRRMYLRIWTNFVGDRTREKIERGHSDHRIEQGHTGCSMSIRMQVRFAQGVNPQQIVREFQPPYSNWLAFEADMMVKTTLTGAVPSNNSQRCRQPSSSTTTALAPDRLISIQIPLLTTRSFFYCCNSCVPSRNFDLCSG